jgi:hypothetical protein
LRLYKRQVSVTIARSTPSSYFTTEQNAVIIRGLRVRFSINKSLESTPNTGEIEISNLNADTREALSQDKLILSLDAGYDGNLDRVFRGDVVYAVSTKSLTGYDTKLQVADGSRATRHARVNRSFQGEVTHKDAIKAVAESMGLSPSDKDLSANDLQGKFSSGLSLEGISSKAMTKLLSRSNKSWSIQDGRLLILGDRESSSVEAVIVSEDTGMVGSPEVVSATPGKGSSIVVNHLLSAKLMPGVLTSVRSRNVVGLYRVDKVSLTGDTHGSEWNSRVESSPI